MIKLDSWDLSFALLLLLIYSIFYSCSWDGPPSSFQEATLRRETNTDQTEADNMNQVQWSWFRRRWLLSDCTVARCRRPPDWRPPPHDARTPWSSYHHIPGIKGSPQRHISAVRSIGDDGAELGVNHQASRCVGHRRRPYTTHWPSEAASERPYLAGITALYARVLDVSVNNDETNAHTKKPFTSQSLEHLHFYSMK